MNVNKRKSKKTNNILMKKKNHESLQHILKILHLCIL